MQNESFPIDPNLADQLADTLKKQLGKISDDSTEKYIYVNLSMVRLQIVFFLPKLIYAAGVASECGAKVIVITWRPNEVLKKMLEKMGMELLCLEELLQKDKASAIRAAKYTLSFLLSDGSGEGIKKLKIRNMPIGYPIYEDIVRTSDLSTIRSAKNKTCFRKIFHIVWMLYALEKQLKKKKPYYVVADDFAYHEGAQIMLFHKYGARIYNSGMEAEKGVEFNKAGQIIRWGEMESKRIKDQIDKVDIGDRENIEKVISDRVRGKNGRDIDRMAFQGKQVLDHESIVREIRLDPSKRTVVIMAHTFTDAVFGYGDIYFRDYYDWLDQTLLIAEKVTEVNWVLKPHPSRGLYNEKKETIEQMYQDHKKDHIFWLDDKISAETIRNIADVIVTIGGNGGGEFACFGIPAIIVGKPYYAGFGYTIEPTSRASYTEVLRRINNIPKLDKEQINNAKKVFFLKNAEKYRSTAYKDDCSRYVIDLYKIASEESRRELFKSNKGTDMINSENAKKMIEYLDAHDIKNSEYYRRGKKRGAERVT